MKTIFYSTVVLLFAVISGCTGNYSDYGTNEYVPPFTNPCGEDDEIYLSQGGSPGAPKLSIGVGIESGIVSFSWTEIEDADYYELEECYCPSFTTEIYGYVLFDNRYSPEINFSTYFRVRAIIGGTHTGWSNVVKNSFGIMH